jgi:tRNA dimethylallyltransferase
MADYINILKNTYNLLVILGPTASGKTRLAVKLASELNLEIISADSRQVYRGLNIGTGKDIKEYIINGKTVPYHLIDVVDPHEEFNVFEYQRLFFQSFKIIRARGEIPIMVGGTGLYIESVIMNYRMHEVPENYELRRELLNMDMDLLVKRLIKANPSVHNTTDLLDRNRLIRAIEIAEFLEKNKTPYENGPSVKPLIKPIVFGIQWERGMLRKKISERLKKRLDDGMVDEVKTLHQNGIPWDKFDYWGLEYRYISHYLQGKITYSHMFEELNTRIHQYAKKQETWFRRMENKGLIIHWIYGDDFSNFKETFLHKINEIPGKPL